MASEAAARHARRRADYAAVFRSDAGRRVLADLFRFCHADQPSFAIDPFVTAFNEGQRRVFLRITAMLRLGEQDFVKLSTESHND